MTETRKSETVGDASKKGRGARPHPDISRSRLEFLFDGLFAIAMTIMVLELKVPELEESRSPRALLHGLAQDGAGFLAYLVSFAILAMLWRNHQSQYRHIRRIGWGVFIANLGLMVTAAAIPFWVAIFSRYPMNPMSIVFYMGSLFLHVTFSHLQWRFAERAGDLDPEMDPAVARRIRNRTLRGTVLLGFMTAAYATLGFSRM